MILLNPLFAKKNRTYLFIALGVLVLLNLAMVSGFLNLRRNQLIDLLFTTKANPNKVIILTIDETSIRKIGQWPWPRSVFGNLLKKLEGAAVVGIDVNFKENSRLGIADDQALADVLSKSKTPVVLNAEIQPNGEVTMPISSLAAHAQQGFPNLIIDPDGVARMIRLERSKMPSLGLKLVEIFNQNILNQEVDYKTQEPIRISYLGPNETFSSVAAIDVLDNKIPPYFFNKKIVLIGATAPDLQDFHQTPMGLMSGVEIQANVVETLLARSFFHSSRALDMLMISLLALLTAWLCLKIKRLFVLILSIVGLAAAYNLAAFISFDRFFILDLLFPNLAIILSAVLSILVQYFTTAKEKKFIHDSFSRYLSPQVIAELMNDTSKLKLGGQKKKLTILFSDIRGFTSISEKMSPENLSAFLNNYLTLMTDVILDRRGLIDKYIGDAIMAFWGAPLDNSEHALDGVISAIKMITILQDFNNKNSGTDYPAINIGIGLNAGEVTVGNMGSEKRFDYTVIGDSVNLASRLEGLNKIYGTNILITENIKRELEESDLKKHQIMLRAVDRVKVKGKNESVGIFEVVPPYKQASIQGVVEEYEKGLAQYYSGNWSEAITLLENVLTKLPDDGPSRLILQRCLELQKNPIENWDGVWELTAK